MSTSPKPLGDEKGGHFRIALPEDVNAKLLAIAEAEGVSKSYIAQERLKAALSSDLIAIRDPYHRARLKRIAEAEKTSVEKVVNEMVGFRIRVLDEMKSRAGL